MNKEVSNLFSSRHHQRHQLSLDMVGAGIHEAVKEAADPSGELSDPLQHCLLLLGVLVPAPLHLLVTTHVGQHVSNALINLILINCH